jgi:hypothetical protein
VYGKMTIKEEKVEANNNQVKELRNKLELDLTK